MYIIEMSALQLGDILLTTDDEKVSKKIRMATVSDYSHAQMYIGNGSVIESNIDGVHSLNIQRMLFKSVDHVKILRLKDLESYKLLHEACEYARWNVGVQYSIKEAKKVKIPFFKCGNSSNRQFCSRLVAKAYESAGINLVGNSDYCSPGEINRSPLLGEVKEYLRKANAKEIEFAKSDSPLQLQEEITNYILERIRKITEVDIQSFQQIHDFLVRNPSFDDAITRVIRQSKYLEIYKFEYDNNPWRYELDEFNAMNFGDQAGSIAINEYNSAKAEILRYKAVYSSYDNTSKVLNLEYFEIHKELYRNMIELHNKRITVAESVLSRSM